MAIGIKVENTGLTEAIAAYSGAGKKWPELLRRTATTFGEYASAFIQKRYRTGGTTDTRTAVRSGRLRRAYRYELGEVSAEGIELHLGIVKADDQAATLAYAALQEYGGTIKARPGGALAIPLKAALTSTGVARGRPRDFEDTFILKRQSGKPPLIVQKRGDEIVPLFVLLKSVKVPARPALEPTARQLAPRLEAAALTDLRAAING